MSTPGTARPQPQPRAKSPPAARGFALPPAEVCERALRSRDARFDGIFFVGITSTRIYCRPVCPARVSRPDNRRFFVSAASAEGAGFRPCMRCRPELAPGRALVDAVSRLAHAAAHRIAAGALSSGTVADLASELCVSERHLRRALQREIGVSPTAFAQTQRLLFAKHLLTDTALPVSRIAYASGFNSLRRFNAAFRERYRMSPSALRRSSPRRHAGAPNVGSERAGAASRAGTTVAGEAAAGDAFVRLTLSYRPPFAWETTLAWLARSAVPGIEVVADGRYARTISIDGHHGVVVVTDAAHSGERAGGHAPRTHLEIDASPSLLPVLMRLTAQLRHGFDLDAEPVAIDTLLSGEGLGTLVARRPGLRIPAAVDGFETALRMLWAPQFTGGIGGIGGSAATALRALGTPIDTGHDGLTHLAPGAERIVDAGERELVSLGITPPRAEAAAELARAVLARELRLEAGGDPDVLRAALLRLPHIGEQLAAAIVMRVLAWPDAFAPADRALQRAAGVADAPALAALAERWRPWRSYAALHLWQHATEST